MPNKPFFVSGDKDLPAFDPKSFKPNQPPPVVEKDGEEYMIVVSGVDTGLSGKYWADMGNLPPRRSRKSVQQAKVRLRLL